MLTPTGLFYCSRKGRFSDDLTNLSKKGNIYLEEKTALKVLSEDIKRACINKAQTINFSLTINKPAYSLGGYSVARQEDFKLIKYELVECKQNGNK
jgi:hypothetical protein